MPTFSGARRGQYAAGLGDILKEIFRTILPISANGASTFLNETLKAKDSGASQSWGMLLRRLSLPLMKMW